MLEETVSVRRFPINIRSQMSGLVRVARRKPAGAVGGVVFTLTILMAVLAPWITPTDPTSTDVANRLQSPSASHPMGTDRQGRDLLSRIIYGSRLTMYVAIVATLIGTGSGLIIGVASAYYRRADMLFQRIMDSVQAFPSLILAMTVVAVLGASATNVIIAIAIPSIPRANRVVRSAALSIRERDFIEAATAVGCSDARIIFRHILPNVMAPYLIIATALVGSAIVIEASLSFLGLGVPPPAPAWGRELYEAMPYIRKQAYWVIFPAAAISTVVFAVNFLGDALRDVWDPRLRGT